MQNQPVKKQEIRLYNSLSGEKEIFKPIVDGTVGIYTCGPTVYSQVHIGNCRTFISFDIIVRYFRHLGYKVRYVRNITDVGHLEDESGEEGEDKILKRARIESLEPMQLAQKYTRNFHDMLSLFNVEYPDIEPTAAGHIPEQIKIVEKLIHDKLAYEIEGSVYFDLWAYSKLVKTNFGYKEYGVLSRRKIENLLINTRTLEGQKGKKHPQDFALWKKASKSHIMKWSSPWGEGFPGWHIECTAMSNKYLGDVFDIHGGGMDLKFPHHECELAQAQAAFKKNPVNYWVHPNILTLNGYKMSKSTNNILLPLHLFSGNTSLKKTFPPEVVRFFMLQAHYRSVLDFSIPALIIAEKGYYRLMKAFTDIIHLKPDKDKTSLKSYDKTDYFNIHAWRQRCYDAMNDDFNTPRLIAHLFEICPLINSVSQGRTSLSLPKLDLLKTTMQNFISEILAVDTILLKSSVFNQDYSKVEITNNIDFPKGILKKSLRKKLGLTNFSSGHSLKKIPGDNLDDFFIKDNPLEFYSINSHKIDYDVFKKIVDLLIRTRNYVRKHKNWALSDEIRDQFLSLGYTLCDNPDGITTLKKTHIDSPDYF